MKYLTRVGVDFVPVEVDVDAMDDEGTEDLFSSSSSIVHSRDIGSKALDTNFEWNNSPIISSHTIKVMQGTPSPCSKFSPARTGIAVVM